ncbi:MAG: hypothetical protein U9532_02310 ['Conium maculatum' witches'-broom phytoplasma]|nr:hypothetical protein ['Conium maculatum' witches'-broom phytoplasma]
MAVYWTRKIQENHKFRKNNDQNYTLAELKKILLDSEQMYIYWNFFYSNKKIDI